MRPLKLTMQAFGSFGRRTVIDFEQVKQNESQLLDNIPIIMITVDTQEKTVNLKSYYNVCTTEKQIENFRADILLENSTRPIKPLLIEICVTHPCSEEKINSKLPIIEIPINSADDIKEIEKNAEVKGKTYNIPPKDVYKPLEINYPLQKYALFSSGKYHYKDCYKTTCKKIAIPQYEQALLEISVYNQYFDNNYFFLFAKSLGYNEVI